MEKCLGLHFLVDVAILVGYSGRHDEGGMVMAATLHANVILYSDGDGRLTTVRSDRVRPAPVRDNPRSVLTADGAKHDGAKRWLGSKEDG